MDYDNGKIAHMQTTVDLEIPVNIFADDGSDFALAEGTICDIEVWGYGIGFVGNVTDVEINPQAKPDDNNYCYAKFRL